MLQQLELQGASLMLRLEQLRRVVTSTACQYRAFCTWLLKTIQQLERTQDANGALGKQLARTAHTLPTRAARAIDKLRSLHGLDLAARWLVGVLSYTAVQQWFGLTLSINRWQCHHCTCMVLHVSCALTSQCLLLLPAADNSTPLPQCQEIMAFLKGQFLHDIIGPELSVSTMLQTSAWHCR